MKVERSNVMRLKKLRRERGNLEDVIVPLVNKGGQHFAARELGVSAATINKWLKENDYVRRQQYVKRGA